MPYVKNESVVIHFSMVDSTDGETAITSGTPVEKITQDGGSQADCTNAAVHEGVGQWSLTLTASEMDADDVGVQVQLTGAVTRDFQIHTIPNDAPTAAAVVDEWETQANADPTGFKVNVMEVNGTAQTANDIGADVDAILVDTGTTIPATISTAQADLDIITGVDGVNLLSGTQSQLDAIDPEVGTTYYVETTGNDSNSGLTPALAFLTVPAATAVSNFGDTIKVGTGTFTLTSNMDLPAGVTLLGEGVGATTIDTDGTVHLGAVRMQEHSTVKNIRVENDSEDATPYWGQSIVLQGDYCTVEDVLLIAAYDGLAAFGNDHATLRNVYSEGKYDGVNLSSCKSLVAENCYFKSTADWSLHDEDFRACITANPVDNLTSHIGVPGKLAFGSQVFINCVFDVKRTGTSALGTHTVSAEVTGPCYFENCTFVAQATNGSYTGDAIGLSEASNSTGGGDIDAPIFATVVGGKFLTTTAGSGNEFDLAQRRTGSTIKTIAASYDVAKTFGTVDNVSPTSTENTNEWETQSQADPTGFHVNVIEVGGTTQTANDIGADVDEILVDTNTTLPATLATAQADLDIITGADGVNLLSATQSQIDDIPTTSEFEARTLVASDYFDPASDTVGTVTTLTNLPAITSNWITSAGIASNALDGKGDWSTTSSSTTLSRLIGDRYLTVPTSGIVTPTITIEIEVRDASGTYVAPDATPTVTWTSINGATIYGIPSGVFANGTGKYFITRSDGAATINREDIYVEVSWAVSGVVETLTHVYTQSNFSVETCGYDTSLILADTTVIVADTNELQTDWADAGRLDTILDTAAAGGSAPTASEIADAVWDEPKADHTGTTTFGDLATDLDTVAASSGRTDQELADAVALTVPTGKSDNLYTHVGTTYSGGALSNIPVPEQFTVVVPPRGSTTNLVTATPLYIQESEKVMVAVDYTAIMSEGDYISTIDATTELDGKSIVLEAVGTTEKVAKLWVSGIILAEMYRVAVTVTTHFGLTMEADFNVFAGN